ncbi:endonuclease III [Ruminococcus albus]|uniref:Endonuclease III n=1 Tax=Ruminococcus albus TaxID=1264 RepID=A0A1I1EN94_RUMAL|nr:endonuclease III [Ruminococcus albus]SFB86383.1 DNA-(apurinic or apyrimidinic site) lyase /endonuclease III [Ruminococcus albus]
MNLKQKKDLALQVIEGLEKQYPDAKCSLEYSQPHELLIATRLSAQCTDARVNIVTKDLFAKYHSIAEFADADISDIEEIVKPCGLYKTKAKSIKEMCIQLRDEHGGTLPDTLEGLTKLSGIGRKTANLIMGDIYHKPAVVTDTHCIRITGRLGLVKSKEPAKVEQELWKILPPDKSNDLCHRLVLFGREFCTARSPKCGGCPLRNICVSKSE